ncbi:hypothetical protein LuPra_01328 [Luteitalea pratensis]|uniref:Uncharacterized protein n=1 Tax=Luteitalea pratensis TaxID=1855912 RepID=A0A143PIR6_LUTPR|nr:transporter [Luteitalea pratensis]AMY08140.1 hypothetical protein LuPra_01328 [Luteitalea pratensis]
MRVTRPAFGAAVLVIACCGPVSAQTTPTTPTTPTATPTTPTAEGLTLAQTLNTLARTAGSASVASALALATSLEVGTTPLITASPSFTYKVDPATGLRVRQATSFGPSFSERALTSGEGKVAVYVSVTAASYEQLGDFSLERMQLTNATGPTAASTRKGFSSLVLQAETLLMSSSVGVTDKLDLSVGVPLVRMSVDGISWMEDGNENVVALAKGAGTSTGLGDMAVSGKYRLTTFGEGPPDPGGIALVATVRLPTGDKDNFRGLGVTRTMVSAVVSTGKARFRPHGNVGFDFWSDGIDAITDDAGKSTVTARHQFQYAAGFEFAAAPKLTLLVDLLGRHILGAGHIGIKTETPTPTSPLGRIGATSVDSFVALDEGINKLTLAPGVRLNLKGSFVLSLNALATLRDNGLHDKFIPVVGLDWTF